jgi:hypothetical protein
MKIRLGNNALDVDTCACGHSAAKDHRPVMLVGQTPSAPWWQSTAIRSKKTAGYKAEFEAAAASAIDWIRQPGNTVQIPAVKFGGMMEIFCHPEFSGADGYLTRYFLDEVGWTAPSGSSESALHTYRYYPTGNDGTENHKGGGRDHLRGDDGPSNEGIKGSGINEVYSAVNGSFAIENFRRNGLLELPETLVEQGVGLRIAALGGPLVPHLQLALLPRELQEKIQGAIEPEQGAHWTKYVAVQVVRDLRMPRESMVKATPEQAARIIGFQTFFNIGHGAMAPANQAGGRFLDLGHCSFNPPCASGLYRCGVCKGDEGTTAKTEDWFLSSLGLYYPGADSKSYTFDVQKKDAESILSEMVKLLNPAADATRISQRELDAMRLAWKEELPFAKGIEYESHILKFGEEILGAPLSREFQPHKISLSLRFIMQVAALRYVLPKAQADVAKALLLKMAENERPVRALYEMFDRALGPAKPTQAMLRPLFNQEIPVNMMMERVEKALGGISHLDMNGVQEAAKRFLGKETLPVIVTPDRFFATMKEVFA